MKHKWITTFVTLLTLTLLAGTLVAKETKDRPKSGDRPAGPKRAGRRPGGPAERPDIGLTDAQKAEIETIRKTAMPKIKDAKPKDRKALFAKMREDIQAVFTEEQLEKLKKARQQGGRGDQGSDLGLTDAQKKQIAEIRKAAAIEMKKAKPEDRKAIAEATQAKIDELLTPEQREKLKKFRQSQQRRGQMPDIGLTDEQKAKMADIRKTAMANKDATPAERKAAFELMKKEIEKLLTPEQLEKFKKARQGGPRRGGVKGRGDRKGPRPGANKTPRKRPASK